jgi:glycosyltransferase involved in cell wall biosynthesis
VIDACARAGLPLVIAGDGPQRAELEARAARGGAAPASPPNPAAGPVSPARDHGAPASPAGRPGAPPVRFVGHVSADELAALRARAAVAVVPSRYAEILPLAALESMAAGLPTVAAASGGLIEAVPEEGRYPPGDVDALATRLRALYGDAGAGERALARARARWSPEVIARELQQIYSATSPS